MRIEQAHYLAFGIVGVVVIWLITRGTSRDRTRRHLRLLALSFGLGMIVVPGHGEIVAAPILATLFPPRQPALLMLAGAFLVLWWAVALGFSRLWDRWRSRRDETMPSRRSR